MWLWGKWELFVCKQRCRCHATQREEMDRIIRDEVDLKRFESNIVTFGMYVCV